MPEDKQPINKDVLGNFQLKENMEKKLTELTDYVTSKHSKTLATRIDVTYPRSHNAPADNSDMSKAMAKYVQKNKRKGVDTYYFFAREQVTSHNPHFHLAVFQNGHKVQSGYKVKKDFEELWGSTLKIDVTGCVHYCDKDKNGNKQPNGVMLDRAKPDYDEKCSQVKRRNRYLVKSFGKGQPKDGIRDFGMSREKK